MMDICTRELPVAREKNKGKGEIGNDFAVKEVCFCIAEAEEAGIFPKEKIKQWRAAMTGLKAEDTYSCQPQLNDGTARNWCVFGSASECVRIMTDMGGDRAYADKYLGDQLRFFDGNGMYMDSGQPMVYDFVTRLQYMLALHAGYDGPHRETIEKQLLKSAEPTLLMLSARGEIPYGGRSNAFLHNNTFYAAVCEYYASWMKSLGRLQKAGAPAVTALASPCPELAGPHYRLDVENPGGLAIAPDWEKYSIVKAVRGRLVLTDSVNLWDSRLSSGGLRMILKGPGHRTMTLPAFETDGETRSEITCDGHTLCITFKGWRCIYTTNGTITDSKVVYGSRNGHLRRFDVSAEGRLKVRAKIVRY